MFKVQFTDHDNAISNSIDLLQYSDQVLQYNDIQVLCSQSNKNAIKFSSTLGNDNTNEKTNSNVFVLQINITDRTPSSELRKRQWRGLIAYKLLEWDVQDNVQIGLMWTRFRGRIVKDRTLPTVKLIGPNYVERTRIWLLSAVSA